MAAPAQWERLRPLRPDTLRVSEVHGGRDREALPEGGTGTQCMASPAGEPERTAGRAPAPTGGRRAAEPEGAQQGLGRLRSRATCDLPAHLRGLQVCLGSAIEPSICGLFLAERL